jgi:hypothetical protein
MNDASLDEPLMFGRYRRAGTRVPLDRNPELRRRRLLRHMGEGRAQRCVLASPSFDETRLPVIVNEAILDHSPPLRIKLAINEGVQVDVVAVVGAAQEDLLDHAKMK